MHLRSLMHMQMIFNHIWKRLCNIAMADCRQRRLGDVVFHEHQVTAAIKHVYLSVHITFQCLPSKHYYMHIMSQSLYIRQSKHARQGHMYLAFELSWLIEIPVTWSGFQKGIAYASMPLKTTMLTHLEDLDAYSLV